LCRQFNIIKGARQMLISIIGAHGTGKTTLVSKLHSRLQAENVSYIIVNEIARHCPFLIGKSSNQSAQEWIINTQRYFEDNCLNINYPVITDRSIIDQYAYYIYWAGENKAIEEELINRYRYNSRIYLMPLNPAYLIDDGLRPIDVKFQQEIDSIILDILDRLKICDFCGIVHFNENSANEIFDAVKKFAPIENTQKKVTDAKYSYDNDIFNKVVTISNIFMANMLAEQFDELFYKMVVMPRK